MGTNVDISKIVLRNAFSRPATRLYPRVRREPFAATRGHVRFVADTCTYCNICARVCPTDAIVVVRKEGRWTIDPRRCILCGACVDGCRKACLTLEREPAPPITAAEWERLEMQLTLIDP